MSTQSFKDALLEHLLGVPCICGEDHGLGGLHWEIPKYEHPCKMNWDEVFPKKQSCDERSVSEEK